jgi:hypothetical protein
MNDIIHVFEALGAAIIVIATSLCIWFGNRLNGIDLILKNCVYRDDLNEKLNDVITPLKEDLKEIKTLLKEIILKGK